MLVQLKMNSGKKLLTYFCLISAILAIRASTAFACSVCTTALVDRFLPPVILWCGLSVFWFLAVKAVISFHRGIRTGIVSCAKVVLLVLVLGVAGVVFAIGPLGLLALLVPALITTIKAFLPSQDASARPPGVRDLRIVGTIGFVVFVSLSFYSLYIKRVRSEADYILRWSGTGPARAAVSRLVSLRSEGLPDLRVIVQHGNYLAIEKIAESGNPSTHVPFLIEILESTQLENRVVAQIEEALRALSGLELPEGTTPETWRHEWEKEGQKPAVETE